MTDKDFPQVEINSEQTQFVSNGRCTRCPVCGKVICIPYLRGWTYKMINKKGFQRVMCSWTCYRKAEQYKGNGRRTTI